MSNGSTHPVGHDRVNIDVIVDKDDDDIALGETVAVALGEIVAVELDEAVADTVTECDGNEALAVGVVVVVVLDEAVGIAVVDIVAVTVGVDDTISCVKLSDGDVALDVGDNVADIEPCNLYVVVRDDVVVRVIVADSVPVEEYVDVRVDVADCVTRDDVEAERLKVEVDVGVRVAEADREPVEIDVSVRDNEADREPVELTVIDGVAVADCVTLDDVEAEPLKVEVADTDIDTVGEGVGDNDAMDNDLINSDIENPLV